MDNRHPEKEKKFKAFVKKIWDQSKKGSKVLVPLQIVAAGATVVGGVMMFGGADLASKMNFLGSVQGTEAFWSVIGALAGAGALAYLIYRVVKADKQAISIDGENSALSAGTFSSSNESQAVQQTSPSNAIRNAFEKAKDSGVGMNSALKGKGQKHLHRKYYEVEPDHERIASPKSPFR